MGLRFDPVGGGQFKQEIKTIMEAESRPLKQLESRKSREEARLKLFQDFKNKFGGVDKAINDVSSFKRFRELKVDLGDGQNIASVTIDKEKAQPGSYQIQVDSLAARSSIITNGFENPDEPVLGIGFIVMNQPNGESTEIFVDEDNASLRGVANLITNRENSAIRASVVKDSSDLDNPWRLIITAKKEGELNHIDFPEFYFLDGDEDLYIDDQKDAANAVLSIDGFPIELESNDVADFLPGINLHLKQARPDQAFTLTVTEDSQKVTGKMKALVDQLNGIFQFITQQNTVDDKTDTRSSFAGDTGLQTIEYRLRNLLHEGYPVRDNPDSEEYRLVFLNQLGIEFDKTGQISFKEDKFQKALEKDFEGISQAITGDMGFGFQLKEVMGQYTRGGDGVLNMREQGLKNRIKEMDRQIDDKAKRLESKQQALVNQFSKLSTTLSNMQRQQQYLSANLGGGGGGNMVSQLLG